MLKAGMLFERYEIVSRLGAGGMGEVYQARDTELARTVALKVLKAGLDSKRLLREARATAALQHPNAVAIFDVGEENGRPFLVMELLHGKTLSAYFGDASVSLRQKVDWLAQVGSALAAAHELAVVHRDIKPDNIFITVERVAKVLDFGLARGFSGDTSGVHDDRNLGTLTVHTPQGMSPGTPLYMAPEQFKGGPVDGRTDQFALALVAYELLTGSLPWNAEGNLANLLAQVLMAPAPPLTARAPGLPPALQAAILRALAKEPDERFAHMADFVDVLASAFTGSDPFARTQLPPTEAAPRSGPPAARGSAPTPPPPSSPMSASSFLESLARSLRAAELPAQADEGEFEAFVAHRIFDIADGHRLHCAAKECKRSGRVGPLANRPGIARHQLKKANFTFSLFKEWGDYSLPVCVVDYVSTESEEDFLDGLWEILSTFASLRVALLGVHHREDADALIERLREEAKESGWRYPDGTEDLLLIGQQGADSFDWRVVRRSASSDEWRDAGSVLARGPQSGSR